VVDPRTRRARSLPSNQAFREGQIKRRPFRTRAGKIPCFPTSRVGLLLSIYIHLTSMLAGEEIPTPRMCLATRFSTLPGCGLISVVGLLVARLAFSIRYVAQMLSAQP